MATAEPDPAKEIIRTWLHRLTTDAVIMGAIRSGGQVEVRLFCHRGEVRKDPVVVLNAGPSTSVGVV